MLLLLLSLGTGGLAPSPPIAPAIPLSSPITDLQLTYYDDPVTGNPMVDFVLTPHGNLALVANEDRLVQDVLRFLLTPLGAVPLDPAYGNPLYGLLGLPYDPDDSPYQAMVAEAEAWFLARQTGAFSQGFLSRAALVDHFGPATVVPQPGSNSVFISFTVYTMADTSATVSLAL